jgi:TPR repeat protein
MPADVPFNLDDLDSDARAMAEAAAKAAGISVSEWVSRIVLVRAGLTAPGRTNLAREPSQSIEPPKPEPTPDVLAEDIDETSPTAPVRAGKGKASAANLDASSTITVTPAPTDSAPRQVRTAPPGASARRTHAPLSVSTDSSTIVIKRSVVGDRPKARDAAPVEPATEESPTAAAGATAAQPAHAVDPFESNVSMTSIEGQDDTRSFLADPLSAPENEEPLRQADWTIPATGPATSEETATGTTAGGSTAEEPIDPSLAATSPERISDLSDLSVDTDMGGDAGGEDLPSGRRRALLLGSVALSLVAAAIWFSIVPVFETGSEVPIHLPSLLSALKAPIEEKSSPPSPDEATASPSTTDAPSAVPATPSAAAPEPSQQLAALKQLADSGDRAAQHDLAVRYARGDGTAQDYREAARWFRAAALQGVANAQYNIGVLTERGLGVEANSPMALLWYLAAAGKGHSAAEYNIGLIYAEGKGVEVNPVEAMKWFQRAADRGFTRAQYNLAVMHERGVENRIDLIEAYRWYRIAAAGGDSGAELRLAEIRGRMSPGEIVKGEELARQPLSPSTP